MNELNGTNNNKEPRNKINNNTNNNLINRKYLLESLRSKNITNYLDKDDLIHLSQCSKEINLILNKDDFMTKSIIGSPQAK